MGFKTDFSFDYVCILNDSFDSGDLWSTEYNSYAICFSNTNRTNLTNLLGCDMVYIRGIREICGQLNIIHTLIFFSNTNRTNLTNLLGCDPVCIRGIREITSLWSVGLRQISWSTEYNSYANMFFFEH